MPVPDQSAFSDERLNGDEESHWQAVLPLLINEERAFIPMLGHIVRIHLALIAKLGFASYLPMLNVLGLLADYPMFGFRRRSDRTPGPELYQVPKESQSCGPG